MFGLGSLLFVRDYVYGPQGQQNTSILAQENNRQGEPSFAGSNASYKLRYRRQLDDDIVVGELSRNSRAFLTPEPCLTENRTSTPAGLIENPLDPNECLSQSHKELAPDYNLSRALKAQSESPSSPEHNSGSSSLPLVPPNKIEHPTKSRHLRDLRIESTGFNSLSKAQLFPQRQISPLTPAIKNRGRAPSQAAQSVSKVRRLSPLRESSGIIDRNSEPEQQILVVQKTHKLLQQFLRNSEPFDRLCKLKVPDRAFKLSLSPTSSFSEDYTNNTAFLGRHRTLSSPELCRSLCHSRLVSRTASVSNLRHLPTDKGRTLYIGVDAHRIFLPPKQHRSSNETVKYRESPREERQIPAMTPYAILPSRNFEKFESMSPTKVAPAGPTPAVDSTGNRQRSSSDASNAGSDYSNITTIVEDAEMSQSSIMDTATNERYGQFFNDLALTVLQHEEARREGFPADMESMMSSFQASLSNATDDIEISPHTDQAGTYFTFSDTLSALKVVSVNSETSFHDEAAEAIAEKRVNFMPDVHPVGSSTPSGNHSTTDSESLDRENFWVKLGILLTGCFSTR